MECVLSRGNEVFVELSARKSKRENRDEKIAEDLKVSRNSRYEFYDRKSSSSADESRSVSYAM